MAAVATEKESAVAESARVQIQIVLYQSQRWLPKLMAGLRQLVIPAGGLHVAIWDNDPQPGTARVIAEAGLGTVTYRPSPAGNLGFGAAHNALAALAPPECEHLLLLNPDAVPHYDCLARLLEVADRSPRAALIEAAQFPIEHPKGYDPDTRETNWSSAACLLVRRSAFLELGGFDDALFLYCEDVDLSWRAWLAGWRCLYVPEARCVHVTEDQDLVKDRSPEVLNSHLGHLYLRRKYFGAQAAAAYAEQLSSRLAPSMVAQIRERLAAMPEPELPRAENPHITLMGGEVYAERRW